ncbi:MAG: hypothetical protein AMXMBFR84_04410 [Candidatus Hydrogenedentota bacterium]
MNESTTVQDFFGLREQPFAATADPAYFYATATHRECLFRLWNSVDERHGIAVVLGNYGTGKTTLLRKLLTAMRSEPNRYTTGVIACPIPSWTSFSLLEAISRQFGLKPGQQSFVSHVEALYRHLYASRNRIMTLVIDDAQNLNKRGQLELLRLVQNLETSQHKLLNLVLFAQMEWIPVLRAAPNFEQRINMTYVLDALSIEETRDLVEFRIRQAGGGERAPLFDDNAIQALHAYAEGSPRITINLCRNALLLAAQLRTRHIGHGVILHTIQKTTLPDEQRHLRVVDALGLLEPEPATVDPPSTVVKLHEEAPMPRSGQSRASQLLLKAARTNPTWSALTGTHDAGRAQRA